MKAGIDKGVAFFDIHFPKQNHAAMAIGLKFLQSFKPDIFIFGGDALDLAMISSFNKTKPKLVEGKRLSKNYTKFKQEIFNPVNKALSKKCEKYFIVGNHEQRLTWLTEAEPQFEGFIELENNLPLQDWNLISFGGIINLGEMFIIHGDLYSEQHAKKNVQNYACNIFSGHVHTNQIYTMNSPISALPRQGVSVGCLSDTNPDYKNCNPNAWINQFLIFYIYPDGTFSYLTPIILNNKAIIFNKLYQYNPKTKQVTVKVIQ